MSTRSEQRLHARKIKRRERDAARVEKVAAKKLRDELRQIAWNEKHGAKVVQARRIASRKKNDMRRVRVRLDQFDRDCRAVNLLHRILNRWDDEKRRPPKPRNFRPRGPYTEEERLARRKVRAAKAEAKRERDRLYARTKRLGPPPLPYTI